MKRNILIFVFLILAATSFKYRSKTQAGILNPDSRVLIEQTADSSNDPVTIVKTENDEIRSLDNQEREAYIKKDTVTLSRLWSPNLIVTNPDNSVKTISDIKNDFSKSSKSIPAFDRIIEKITINDNVAIVMGHENAITSNALEFKEKNINRRFSNIWMKDGSTWKLAARQATNISDK
ncbi:nuclear transport factor 2 family protein [Dyadobacter subterraneus]|uniref:Nuclear transport factor 2 family protein n=1 Tax=Dyadobacter subterraneus TaxID=2773304 RepID=A0ABR9W5U3_9BACT|nr:nuclear transport factor 2 family protein [Dyadobacter subterraneus]MBE9460539.1 nuclear transport factor 2 family protein [Dyadobacter subterraneus]